jgi:HEAT repeat protein
VKPAEFKLNPSGNGRDMWCYKPGQLQLEGMVRLPGGALLVAAGNEVSRGRGNSWSAPVRSGKSELPSARLLPARELAAIPALLRRRADASLSLLDAAGDDRLRPWLRGLAIWLLGDIGDRQVVPGLIALYRAEAGAPPVVRSAAVRSLSMLSEVATVREALRDPEEAVAQAAVQHLPAESGKFLRKFASERRQPAFLRACAADRANQIGMTVELEVLLSLQSSEDADVRRIATKLIGRTATETHAVVLLEMARTGEAAERAAALRSLADLHNDGALPVALAEIAGRGSPSLRAASIYYLAVLEPEALEAHIAEALTDESREVRSAMLRGLHRNLKRYRGTVAADHRESLEKVATSSLPSPADRALALTLLADPKLVSRVLGQNADPELLFRVLTEAANRNLPLTDPELLDRGIRHPRSDIRTEALRLLAQQDPGEALQSVDREIQSGESGAPVAIEALIVIVHGDGQVDAVQALRLLLRTAKDGDVRRQAAELLALLRSQGREQAGSVLIGTAGDRAVPLGVRLTALRELRGTPLTGPIERLLLDGITDEEEEFAVLCARLLRNARQPLGAEALHDVRSPMVRAILAPLANSSPKETRDLLEADSEVAAIALFDLRGEALPAYAREIDLLCVADDPLLRSLALCRLPPTKADRERLRERGTDPDPLVRFVALAALESRGEKVIPAEALAHLRAAAERYPTLGLEKLAVHLAKTAGGSQDLLRELEGIVRGAGREVELPSGTGRHDLARKQHRRFAAAAAAAVLAEETAGAADLVEASRTLTWAGERADLAPLLALADRDHGASEACATAAEALLGRTASALVGGVGIEGLVKWWEDRAYALDIPALGWNP